MHCTALQQALLYCTAVYSVFAQHCNSKHNIALNSTVMECSPVKAHCTYFSVLPCTVLPYTAGPVDIALMTLVMRLLTLYHSLVSAAYQDIGDHGPGHGTGDTPPQSGNMAGHTRCRCNLTPPLPTLWVLGLVIVAVLVEHINREHMISYAFYLCVGSLQLLLLFCNYKEGNRNENSSEMLTPLLKRGLPATLRIVHGEKLISYQGNWGELLKLKGTVIWRRKQYF